MKNQLQDVQERILSVLSSGDILCIVPPFTHSATAVLAPHILQSIAAEEGYTTDILYLNMLLASILGRQLYDDICSLPIAQYWMMAGERMFARSAYELPPLGRAPELIADEAACFTGNKHQHVKTSYMSAGFETERLAEIEEICTAFVHKAVKAIALCDYKIVGCTTMLEQTNCSVALLNEIKKIRPATTTIIGGTNCEGEMAEGIASLSRSIDYVFSGESDKSFKRFLQNYSQGRLPVHRIIIGEPLEDLNTLSCPDYGNFFRQMRHFFGENTPQQLILSYETSRGCWWGEKQKCSFCGLNGDAKRILFRQKTEEKMVADLEQIADRYPVTGIRMTDNIMPRSYYERLFPILSEKKDFPAIWYEEKAHLTLQDFIQLKEAGITSTLLGIESFSTGLLKLMNKGVSAKQNLLLLRHALSVGISTQWYLLWGLPGDRIAYYEEILKLIPLIRHFQPPIEFVHLKLLRFSSYRKHPHAYGVSNLQPLEVYKHVYPEYADIEKLAYYFRGDYPCEAHEYPTIIQKIGHEIEEWKKTWKQSTLAIIPVNENYMIYDTRGQGKSKNYAVEYPQAKNIMSCEKYTGSEHQHWAIEKKLGVVVDSWYVPLVTASVELLRQFEQN